MIVFRFFGIDILGNIWFCHCNILHSDIFYKIQSEITFDYFTCCLLLGIFDMWYYSFGTTWGVYKIHARFGEW
jgi:hypothetical protein